MLTEKEIKKFNTLVQKNDARLSIVFKALSDPKRCRIYRILIKERDHDLYVTDIARIMGISLPSASQHLKILEITGLLSKERRGKHSIFRLNMHNQIANALAATIL